MRQTEVEIPRPSSTNSKDSDDNMNLPIALRKGVETEKTKGKEDSPERKPARGIWGGFFGGERIVLPVLFGTRGGIGDSTLDMRRRELACTFDVLNVLQAVRLLGTRRRHYTIDLAVGVAEAERV
ncbi:phosphatidylcholine:diacylglycerol cholinephosphotransferase 1-like [Senna tora]|uniref:Phosphatidylcholine:diacylglycerol cholinephosphotransferase 1-like n=1 Tax=Senna tora TaxID=362788 RepID=A0A834SN45_9FABA|nr:phosphatidylcholine:diacylglycerol cholinephosphotransferase 1-like [Senna tora]